jgi:DNA-directed RNA polymerase subunit H (RpoH/RPB5)
LYDIGQARNVNLLDRFKSGADDQLKADIGIFIKKLQQLPTEYFEIKPQRAVSVSEFEGAIVPANAPKRSIEYLRSQGINDIYFYETPEERTALFKKFNITTPREKLPWIDSQDPPVKWIGGRPGDIIEVTRHSAVAGTQLYYRFCVPDVNVA